MDGIITPIIHPFAGEECRDIVKIIIGEESISLTELEARLCDDYAQEIVIGESKISLINCLWRIDEFLSIVLNDGLIDRSYQATGSIILDRLLRGDCFYDVVKFLIGEEEIALMQLKRYLFEREVVINGEVWSSRYILNSINKTLREYKIAYNDIHEKMLKKKRDELRSKLIAGAPLNFGVDKPVDKKFTIRIPTGKLVDAVDEDLRNQLNRELEKERKELLELKKRKELLQRLYGRDPLLPWEPKTDTRYSSPIGFLNEVNQFQKFVERYFLTDDFFGAFGAKFPIKSYMRLYDLIRLLKDNQKFRCIYTRDGLGGWMNILAINKGTTLDDSVKHIVSEHFKAPNEKSYETEREQFGKLREYLDSLSAKKHIYTSFSEMGCLQYLHFAEFGEAFAFDWHALPRRKYVLTSVSDIHSIYTDLKGSDRFRIVGDIERLLSSFRNEDDLKPTIVFHNDRCTIEWVEFHTHRGVFQRRYELGKKVIRCNSSDGINEYCVPGNIKLVNEIKHLMMIPLFRY